MQLAQPGTPFSELLQLRVGGKPIFALYTRDCLLLWKRLKRAGETLWKDGRRGTEAKAYPAHFFVRHCAWRWRQSTRGNGPGENPVQPYREVQGSACGNCGRKQARVDFTTRAGSEIGTSHSSRPGLSRPYRLGTHHLVRDLLVQVTPSRVALGYKPRLPRARPMLHVFFALNCVAGG